MEEEDGGLRVIIIIGSPCGDHTVRSRGKRQPLAICNNRKDGVAKAHQRKYCDISMADKDNIQQPLTALKCNLNGYGYHLHGQYPSEEMLDYFKDEHIWKEIDGIENPGNQKQRWKTWFE